MGFRVFVASIVASVALTSVVFAQDDRHDRRVAEEISSTIRMYPQFSIFDDVSGVVEAGIVTLRGKVTMPFKREQIETRVARIDGVREIRNEISVLPASIFDDTLRRRIARAIYGNPSFWSYAAMANPPIHIIVENGHVTLTGMVNSNVERAIARSLATGFGEFSVSNQLRTELRN